MMFQVNYNCKEQIECCWYENVIELRPFPKAIPTHSIKGSNKPGQDHKRLLDHLDNRSRSQKRIFIDNNFFQDL